MSDTIRDRAETFRSAAKARYEEEGESATGEPPRHPVWS